MDLGAAIAIYVSIAIVLMIIFCLIAKYFNYRLNKAMNDANQVYSMIDDICRDSDQQIEGEYDEFIKRRRQQQKKGQKDEELLQMKDFKQPLNVSNDIYGMSVLRKNLNESTSPLQPNNQTNRSMGSIKSFKPERLNTSSNDSQRKNQITSHKFVSKIVSYTENGINILDIKVISIKKTENGIKQKKSFKRKQIKQSSNDFADGLQINGFDKGQFGFYKYETTIEVPNMKNDKDYMIKSLKSSQSKEKIQKKEFEKLIAQAQYSQ